MQQKHGKQLPITKHGPKWTWRNEQISRTSYRCFLTHQNSTRVKDFGEGSMGGALSSYDLVGPKDTSRASPPTPGELNVATMGFPNRCHIFPDSIDELQPRNWTNHPGENRKKIPRGNLYPCCCIIFSWPDWLTKTRGEWSPQKCNVVNPTLNHPQYNLKTSEIVLHWTKMWGFTWLHHPHGFRDLVLKLATGNWKITNFIGQNMK